MRFGRSRGRCVSGQLEAVELAIDSANVTASFSHQHQLERHGSSFTCSVTNDMLAGWIAKVS